MKKIVIGLFLVAVCMGSVSLGRLAARASVSMPVATFASAVQSGLDDPMPGDPVPCVAVNPSISAILYTDSVTGKLKYLTFATATCSSGADLPCEFNVFGQIWFNNPVSGWGVIFEGCVTNEVACGADYTKSLAGDVVMFGIPLLPIAAGDYFIDFQLWSGTCADPGAELSDSQALYTYPGPTI